MAIFRFMVPPGYPSKSDFTNWFYFSIKAPMKFAFNCLKTQQKGHVIYSGDARGTDLDAASSVPFIKEEGTSPVDLVDVLLTQDPNQWQREIDFSRASEIGTWWDDNSTSLLNPVILSMKPAHNFVETSLYSVAGVELVSLEPAAWQLPDCPACGQNFNVVVKKDPLLLASFKHALAGHKITYNPSDQVFMDQCCNTACPKYGDYISARPFEVPDGQHRLRGTQTTNAGSYSESPILFTLMPSKRFDRASGFTPNDSAKIFTDVNIRPKQLHENHKLTMAWRFGMEDAVVWGTPYDFSTAATRASRSYEAILRAAGSNLYTRIADNPLYGKVLTLDDDTNDTNSLIKLQTIFQEHVYPNTAKGKPWARTASSDIAEQLIDYLYAIRALWAGKDPSGTPYWAPNFTNKLGGSAEVEINPVTMIPWGVLSARSKPSDGQTGGLDVLMRLYHDVRFVHSGSATLTPIKGADIGPILTPIRDLNWGWFESGETTRQWAEKFARDVIRGSGVIAGEVLTDADLLTRLRLPSTPNLNDLLQSGVWYQHPRSSSSGTELPRITPSGLVDASGTAVTSAPTLALTDSLEYLQPMNAVKRTYVYVRCNSGGADEAIATHNAGSARLEYAKGQYPPVGTTGSHSLAVADVQSHLHSKGYPPSTGDAVEFEIRMRNAWGLETTERFQFIWP